MLFTLGLCLTLSDGLLCAQHGRTHGEGKEHGDGHDDGLRVVLLDCFLELVDFLEEFLLAKTAKELLESALGRVLGCVLTLA